MTAATKPRQSPGAPGGGGQGASIFSLSMGRDALAAALSRATLATTTKVSLPILSAVKMRRTADGLSLVTTDLDRTLTLLVPIPETASLLGAAESDEIALPAKRLLDIVTQMPPGDVQIEVTALGDACKARVSSGRSRFEILGLPVKEFPAPDPVRGTVSASFPAAGFIKALAGIATFVSTEQSRPTLNGILIDARDDGLFLVATDSYHLGTERLAPAQPATGGWILPRSAVVAISKLFASSKTIDFAAEATRCRFSDGDATLDIRLINGPYPSYRPLLSMPQTREATVDRLKLIAAVKRMLTLSEINRVSLSWRPGEVTVRAEQEGAGRAEDALPCTYVVRDGADSDEGFTTSYQPSLLLGALAVHDSAHVRIEMKSSTQPAYIRDADDAAGDVFSLVVGLNAHVPQRISED